MNSSGDRFACARAGLVVLCGLASALQASGEGDAAPPLSATITPTTLFGDSYIVRDGVGADARVYSVLDVYIKGSSAADIISSVFGVSAFVSSFSMNSADCFVHSNQGSDCWKPVCGQPAWDSFLTTGCRDQCAASTALILQLDSNWQQPSNPSCCAIVSAPGSGGAGWYPAVGASTSTNPYARIGHYNGSTTGINTAKTCSNIPENGITVGQSLNNHWMIGRFAIDVTHGVTGPRTMTLKFAIAGKQNGTTTFTGATSTAGRFNDTLSFALSGGEFPACPADFDGNRVVDSADVALILLDYGACGGCPTDLDLNGVVDSADVALILLDYGPCAPCLCPGGCS